MTRCTISSGVHLLSAATILMAGTSCADTSGRAPAAADAAAVFRTGSPPEDSVGIALEVDEGVGVPVQLRAGERFHLDQIDLRASVIASVDEGVAGLDLAGDFADLEWGGVALHDEEFVTAPNADGTFTRRRFYRDADWMEGTSELSLTQIDANGAPLGPTIDVDAGNDNNLHDSDAFFIRRLRAIQWTYDCVAPQDCGSASDFMEEALVELRHATDQSPAFDLDPATVAFELTWSAKPGTTYVIPVTQVAAPAWDYGVQAELTPVTLPTDDGYYLPGQDITFRLTLKDGSGNRLHAEGSLPTYAEVSFGVDQSGIRYWRGPFESTATFWRRKHREAMLSVHFVGPAQDVQPIRTVVEVDQFFAPYVTAGLPSRDGVLSEAAMVPPAATIFTGAWNDPVSDLITFGLTDDAQPGTYFATVKGRRVYLGQDIPFSETIEVLVGTPTPTSPQLGTGPCNTCHSGGGSLDLVGHANDNRATCAGCHAPLVFEPEGPIFVRVHYIHSRSDRVDGQIQQCSTCHLTEESIQRTSKAACLSCHTDYPADHVEDFGPITSSYVGGGFESFDSCDAGCHTSHPADGL